jgi:Retroviral aspartyl protease
MRRETDGRKVRSDSRSGLKKLVSSPPASTQAEGCVDPIRATNEVRLNASVLSASNPLTILLTSNTVVGPPFPALVDSGSTHFFLDSDFILKHKLPTQPILTIPLCLFDGSTKPALSEVVDLSICFTTGDIHEATFYVTLLDASCSAVLGHNWLTRHNPSIDWVSGQILFHTQTWFLSSLMSSAKW